MAAAGWLIVSEASSKEELSETADGDVGKNLWAPPGAAGEGERERMSAARPAAPGALRRPWERVFGRVESLIRSLATDGVVPERKKGLG